MEYRLESWYRHAARGIVGCIVLAGSTLADDRLFDIAEVAMTDRVVTAHPGDFDGDGRTDLMIATISGIPPAESRRIALYLQAEDGRFARTANFGFDIPRDSAVYDVGDVVGSPGDELIFLRPDRVTIAAFDKDGSRFVDRIVDRPDTVAAGADERGFDPYPLVFEQFDDEPWLLVPQISAMTVMTAGGRIVDRLEVSHRANYFVARPAGIVSFESDIQLFLDTPKLSVGDVDGDGLSDVLLATRHELQTFLRVADGGFERSAAYSQPLGFVTEEDHWRGSGGVATTGRDVDADGRMDLLISHVEGSLTNTVTNTYVVMNRNGRWDVDRPLNRFTVDKTLSSDLLLDIDRDPQLELLRVQLKFTVLELVELLLQRRMDAVVAIHQFNAERGYGDEPWSDKKLSTGFSFDTFRPKGFMPRGQVDLNADGYMDFVTSADGDGIEVWLGGEDGPFRQRPAEQDLPSAGRIRFADFNGDGLPDFLLFDPQIAGSPVRIGLNRGRL